MIEGGDWMKVFLVTLLFFLSGCAERPLIGVTVTNSPDTLPCAPGKFPSCGK